VSIWRRGPVRLALICAKSLVRRFETRGCTKVREMNGARPGSRKRSKAVIIPSRNANKHFSYREAWVRIKKARGFQFYLEAVTLEESIIADRLISFLVYVGEIQKESAIERYSFGQLIQLWTKRVPQPVPVKDFHDLRSAVDEWRRRRNRVVHSIVKSLPGAPHGDVLDFLKEAEFVSFQGQALARALTDWVRKAKRQFIRTKSSSPTPTCP